MVISTQRLALWPLTPELIAAQLERQPRFFSILSAAPRADWPPPYYDDDAMRWTLARLREGQDPRWHARIVTTRKPPGGVARVLGVAGFQGPPSAAGEVEIGYSIVSSEQRRGVGTEALAALVGFALGRDEVQLISARTLSGDETIASRRMLERAGFAGPLPTDEDGVVRYELRRRGPQVQPPSGWVFRDLTR